MDQNDLQISSGPWCPGSAAKLVPSSRKSEAAKSVPKARNKLAMKLEPLWLKSSFKKVPFLGFGTKLYPTLSHLHAKSNAWVWERDVHGAHMHTKGRTEWVGEETRITRGVSRELCSSTKDVALGQVSACERVHLPRLRPRPQTALHKSRSRAVETILHMFQHRPELAVSGCSWVFLNASKWCQGKNHGQ